MVKKLSGLGRGLDALLPSNFATEEVIVGSRSGVEEIDITYISPKIGQPRTVFDEEKIEQLSYSIKEHGILQPLVLVEVSNDEYVIIAGERRFRAAKKAGLKKVPAVVRTASELQQLELALVENIQREDLGSLEQATSIKRLHEEFGQSYEQIAKRLGKAQTTVVNLVRLLGLGEKYQKALADGKISEGHARALLALAKNPDAQEQLFGYIVSQHWSVRRAELFVTSFKESSGSKEKTAARLLTETKETKSLAARLNRDVRIQRTAKGGKVTIAFKDDADLQLLLKDL